MNIITILGLIGGLCTASGGIPQIYKMIKTKQTKDLSWYMVLLWLVGLSITCIYGICIEELPVYLNAIFSIIQTTIIIILKVKYDNRENVYQMVE